MTLPTTCTSGELAQALGVTERSVAARRGDRRLPVTPEGRVDLTAVIKAGVDALGKRTGPDDEDGPPDLSRERALLARAQREGQNMKNAVLRGELLPIDDVEAVTGAALDAVRAKVLALPTRAAPECLGLAELNDAKEVLTGLVHDCLADIASCSVVVAGAVDRARRRIGRGAASDTVDQEAGTAPAADSKPVGG
jgi:hypothetical protein